MRCSRPWFLIFLDNFPHRSFPIPEGSPSKTGLIIFAFRVQPSFFDRRIPKSLSPWKSMFCLKGIHVLSFLSYSDYIYLILLLSQSIAGIQTVSPLENSVDVGSNTSEHAYISWIVEFYVVYRFIKPVRISQSLNLIFIIIKLNPIYIIYFRLI